MKASVASGVRANTGNVWKVGLLAGGVAAVANVVLYLLTKAFGVSFLAYIGPSGQPQAIPVGMVIIASVVGALAATLVRLALSRRGTQGIKLFRIIGGIFLVVSFGGPMTAAADGATRLVLILMHIIAGYSIIRLLSRDEI